MKFNIFDNNKLYFLILIMGLSSCVNNPIPIEYGADLCEFCKMTIVDTRHAAQMVTSKGKTYNYDSIECMIKELKNDNKAPYKLLMVSDFMSEKKMINAYASTFLISKNIPSPMGAYLSAFEFDTHATQMKLQNGGELYTFEQVLEILP